MRVSLQVVTAALKTSQIRSRIIMYTLVSISAFSTSCGATTQDADAAGVAAGAAAGAAVAEAEAGRNISRNAS